jgi:hypothetical protein
VDLVARRLSAVSVPRTSDSSATPLRELAARYGTAAHPVAAAIPEDEGLRLEPPLLCPRCGESISSATWGTPQPEVFEFRGWDIVISKTRSIAPEREVEFVAPNGFRIRCTRSLRDNEQVNEWLVRFGRDSHVIKEDFVAELLAHITKAGHRHGEPEFLRRQCAFIEWIDP